MKQIKLRKLDPYLLLAPLLLVMLSLVLLYNVQSLDQDHPTAIFWRQLAYALFGLLLMGSAALLSPRVHFALSYVIYGGSCVLLLAIFIGGSLVKGAVRWMDLGLFTFQPSEPAKIGLILSLARLVTDKKYDLRRASHMLRAVALTLLPVALVLLQPDLGTSIVFAAIFLFMMVAAGIPYTYLLIIISPALAAISSFHYLAFIIFMILLVVLAWRMKIYLALMVLIILGNLAVSAATPFLWSQLKPYQQRRLLTFVDPEADPKGAGYQVIQSKVAVGSGGILGRGLGQGSQTQLKFLPEQHTDFIFSVVGEELGLLGGSLALMMYGLIIVRGFRTATLCGGRYTSLVCVGLSSMLAVHIFINIGMALGVMPVTGLPLPFLSYGGSFLWTSLISTGLLLGAQLRWGEYTP